MEWTRSTTGIAALIVLAVALIAVLWSTVGRSAKDRAIEDCQRLAETTLSAPTETVSTVISDARKSGDGWAVKGQHVAASGEPVRHWECSTASGEAVITWWSVAR